MKMHGNILEKVRQYEEKRGIIYAKTDGNLYKTVKLFYVITCVYTLFIDFCHIIGNTLSEQRFNDYKDVVYNITILSAVLVATLVIMCFRKHLWAHITAFALNLLSCVGLGIVFGTLFADVIGFKPSFYWQNLIPLSLMVLLSFWLTAIAVGSLLKTRKTYKKIVENAYTQFSANEETVLSDEQWEEILKSI